MNIFEQLRENLEKMGEQRVFAPGGDKDQKGEIIWINPDELEDDRLEDDD